MRIFIIGVINAMIISSLHLYFILLMMMEVTWIWVIVPLKYLVLDLKKSAGE